MQCISGLSDCNSPGKGSTVKRLCLMVNCLLDRQDNLLRAADNPSYISWIWTLVNAHTVIVLNKLVVIEHRWNTTLKSWVRRYRKSTLQTSNMKNQQYLTHIHCEGWSTQMSQWRSNSSKRICMVSQWRTNCIKHTTVAGGIGQMEITTNCQNIKFV